MKCVSLFSGCGGLDLGLVRAGFKVVLANDNEKKCEDSHTINFPKTKFYLGSVKDLTSEKLTELLGKDLRKIDLVAGGPPCPPFSKSRFYRKDKPRALDDPVGFETVSGYFDVVSKLNPKAFLLENVPGFAYKTHSEVLDYVLGEIEKLGYEYNYETINAANFGIPQTRERFILVGTKKSKFKFPEATHLKPSEKLDLFEKSKPCWVPVKEAIGDLDTDENASDEGHFAGGQYHDLLKEIPPGDNYLYFTEKRGHPNPKFKWRSRYWSYLLKLSPDRPSWTIQARRSNNMGPFHWRNRILRIEEVKRIQTFPDSWVLKGTTEQQWRQVGNAVPPLLAEIIGREVKKHINKTAKENRKKI
jgi:DNA (cytosine-5)-methyltransferase 1